MKSQIDVLFPGDLAKTLPIGKLERKLWAIDSVKEKPISIVSKETRAASERDQFPSYLETQQNHTITTTFLFFNSFTHCKPKLIKIRDQHGEFRQWVQISKRLSLWLHKNQISLEGKSFEEIRAISDYSK